MVWLKGYSPPKVSPSQVGSQKGRLPEVIAVCLLRES